MGVVDDVLRTPLFAIEEKEFPAGIKGSINEEERWRCFRKGVPSRQRYDKSKTATFELADGHLNNYHLLPYSKLSNE